MRPYVICHSMSSVDGRIQSSRWGIADAPRFFEEPAAKIKVDAWIVGRTTMQEFSSQKPRKKRRGSFPASKTDFVGVRIDGGGSVNGSFLKAGLIDELSHVVVPVADGSMETPTVFDAERGHTRRLAKRLSLKSIKRLNKSTLWLRYSVHD